MCNRCRPLPAWSVSFVVVALASITRADDEKLTVTALGEAVEILKDQSGISHIYARNEHDLFLAQGYNAARDRLFQLELWRRQATGTLAEIQGRRALLPDIGARLLRFRGDMKRELSHYHPRGNEIVASFVAGINAYIELTEREPARLPLEFKILGIKPGKWTPEVVVSRHNGLFRNVTQEVQYAQLVHLLGSQRPREFLNLHPGNPSLEPDHSLDLSLIGDRVLYAYVASRAALRFDPEDVEPIYRNRDRRDRQSAAPSGPASALSDELSPQSDLEMEGSNNWVVSGADTAFGSCDHGERSAPGGAGAVAPVLGTPGRTRLECDWCWRTGSSRRLGRTQRARAWGFTIFPIDQEDLYVYATDPADPTRYRYFDGWEAMKTIHETFVIKDRPRVTINLRYTRHGPVVYEDWTHHKAYALRAAWLEEGTALTSRA